MDAPYKRGDKVRRASGSYLFPGVVLACYPTLSGLWMASVEHATETGMLHVFRATDVVFRHEGEHLAFRYRNWRGEEAARRVVPQKVWLGTTEHHPQEQWFLRALCLDRREDRDFALKDIAWT